MWIYTTKGFFSVVEHKEDPERIMLRARVKVDIQNIKKIFDDLGLEATDILENVGSDYKYRIFANRMDWVSVMNRLMIDMNYTNFKDAVYETDSYKIKDMRHEAYYKVWSIMYELQLYRM